MSYVALYRKFRPGNFEDVKGQEHVVTTLRNQIVADRIGHAYLFCGTRGTGKTTIAKIFARAVNCQQPVNGSPCGECPICKAISAGASMNVIEIDAASNNGVDNIREIVEEVAYSPTEGRFKVYIIDEVHMLSTPAFNALLKTLEEPPAYVIFILATTEVHKIPVTILSRCQRYDFKRIGIETITARMKELMEQEQVAVQEKALRYIAKVADGSMRDALSLLDQCIAFHFGNELTYDKVLDVLGAVDTGVFSRLLRSVLDRDVSACVALLDELTAQGRELEQFVTDFTWYMRNLMLVRTSDDMEDVIDVSSDNLKLLKEEAEMLDLNTAIYFIRVFSDLSAQIKYSAQKRILTEIALIKLCRPQMEQDTEALLERIRALEEKVEKGIIVREHESGGERMASAESGELLPAKVKQELPKAIPEEVQTVVNNWHSIIGKMQQPARLYLQKAHLSLGEENRLIIVLPEGIASDYFLQDAGNREQLVTTISNSIGRQIEPEIRELKEEERFTDHFVDIAALIHMEIEEDVNE